MNRIEYRDWILDVESQATKQAHARAEPMGPSTCSCADCRNFLAARAAGLVYPSEVIDFLRDVGIDPIVETEIAAFGREESGAHVISGWMHAVGRIVDGPEARVPTGPNSVTLRMIAIEGQFELALLEGKALAPKPLRDHELIQIEFLTRIPWLLPERDPALDANAPVV